MSDPTVTVTLRCDRTGKEVTYTVPLDQYPALAVQLERKRESAARLTTWFQKTAEVPDLVVYYKGLVAIYPVVVSKDTQAFCKALDVITQGDISIYNRRARIKTE